MWFLIPENSNFVYGTEMSDIRWDPDISGSSSGIAHFDPYQNLPGKDALAVAHTAQGEEALMTQSGAFKLWPQSPRNGRRTWILLHSLRSRVPGAWATAWLQQGLVAPGFVIFTIPISPCFPALQNLRNCLSFATTCICNLHQVIQFTVYTCFSPSVDHITGCNFSAVKIRFQHSYILREGLWPFRRRCRPSVWIWKGLPRIEYAWNWEIQLGRVPFCGLAGRIMRINTAEHSRHLAPNNSNC